MVKRSNQPKKIAGTYLAAAVFCDNVIEDKTDGAMTPVRIVDKVMMALPPAAPDDFPSESQKLPVTISSFICFKSFESPGEHTVRAELISPTGKVNAPFVQKFAFPAVEIGAVNFHLRMTIMVVKGGVFWLNIYLDDRFVTRIPLQILIQRQDIRDVPVRATDTAVML